MNRFHIDPSKIDLDAVNRCLVRPEARPYALPDRITDDKAAFAHLDAIIARLENAIRNIR